MSTLIQRVNLDESVQEFAGTCPDANQALAVLELAADYGATHIKPLTLAEVLAAVATTASNRRLDEPATA